MKAQLDFAKTLALPPEKREPVVQKALASGQIQARQAADLLNGKMPSAVEVKSVGATPYAGSGGNARAGKPLPQNSPLFRAAEKRDLAEGPANQKKAAIARQKIDGLLEEIGRAGPNQREAVKNLQNYLGSVGPDVVDAIRGGTMNVEDVGIGYINSRLRDLGTGVVMEPIMDAQSRAFVRASRPGDLRGRTGSISFSYRPHSDYTLNFLRSVGNQDTGMWGATFSGIEAWNFRQNEKDGSVSANIRDLRRGTSGGSLSEVVDGFVAMLGEQPFPGGYTMEIDLDKVPRDQHAQVKASLARLKEYGVELRYEETDPVKIMDAIQDSARISKRIDKLLEKPQAEWSKADWAEYKEVHALYHAQPSRRWES